MQHGVNIFQPPFDGPGNHVRQVIAELENLGHKVSVLFRLDGKIWKTENLEDFQVMPVHRMDRGPLRLVEKAIRRIQSSLRLPYLGLFESLRFALACRQEVAECDLFYERISWLGYGGGWAAKWLKIPLILEENGDLLEDLLAKGIAPKGLQRQLSVWLMGRAMQRASHVVATGDGWRDHFIGRWKYSPDRVTTVENGTELVKNLQRDQLRSFKSSEELQAGVTVVYLGGFYAWHGVPVLLAAISLAAARGADLKLILIGSGDGEEEARRLVSELKIVELVTFTGRLSVEKFAPILACADMGVAPYCGWKEFSGLKLFDYKAAGLAVIVSGQDGKPATIKHGETGWIVPPCDQDALCEAILMVSGNPELRRSLGRKARIDAEKHNGWDHTARQLDHLFKRVVSL
jgi:glycosyltransferase involved in cell wall biosynthesis